ncbi:MAG TPA: DUF4013 domain-containing protein [Myxococcota bacterium]|nr:DUF4013 domain-containing protein [Myxococcota bacterium]
MATADPIDIGAAFSYATSDPDWMKKTAIAGLHMLIPLIGVIALFGWTRDIFWRVRRGEAGIPDMQFGRHLDQGWAPFIALMNVAVFVFVLLLPMMCAGGLIGVAQEVDAEWMEVLATLLMLATQLLVMAFALGVNFVIPELWRRGFHGEMGPIFSFGKSLRIVKDNALSCLLVIVGFFVAQIVGSIGVMACYIGMFLTIPFSYVVMAHLVAQWDALVNPDWKPEVEEEWELASKA